MSERLYKIGEAAQILNLKSYVLRFWESEFIELRPDRTGTGQRMYSEADLELLQFIRHLLHERGLTIEGARKILAKYKEKGLRPGKELPEQAYKSFLAGRNVAEDLEQEPADDLADGPAQQPAGGASADEQSKVQEDEAILKEAAGRVAALEGLVAGTIDELKELRALVAKSGSSRN